MDERTCSSLAPVQIILRNLLVSSVSDDRIYVCVYPMNPNHKPLVSIICPVYNEERAIPLFYDRLNAVWASLSAKYDFELIFTNNRSVDGTLASIQALREKDLKVQVITLSRNFGYQASVLAGISYSTGEATVVIDVDCEDPPEMLPLFIAKWEEGYDIVYGLRANRPEPRALIFMRKLFYRLLRLMADTDIVLDMAEFALVSARVRNVMCDNKNTFPFLRAEIGYSGRYESKLLYTLFFFVIGAVGVGRVAVVVDRTRSWMYGGLLAIVTFIALRMWIEFPEDSALAPLKDLVNLVLIGVVGAVVFIVVKMTPKFIKSIPIQS